MSRRWQLMKTVWWIAVVLLVCASASPAAEPTTSQVPDFFTQGMEGFERNTALGVALTMRPGTPTELDEVSRLAKNGLESARAAVAKHRDSSEAHYLLGSWLLYGYRVIEVRNISIGPQGGEYTDTVRRVVQGLTDDLDEGLAPLRRATELAPARGDYMIDYAAALFDCGRPSEAMTLLQRAWGGQPELSPGAKMRAALLLSDILATEGRLTEARGWVYSALQLNRGNAAAVQRLRWLDAAEAEAEAAAAEEPFVEEEAPPTEEGEWGEEEPVVE
jgi:tetratricopeptide (TPR) repeat protein